MSLTLLRPMCLSLPIFVLLFRHSYYLCFYYFVYDCKNLILFLRLLCNGNDNCFGPHGSASPSASAPTRRETPSQGKEEGRMKERRKEEIKKEGRKKERKEGRKKQINEMGKQKKKKNKTK
jgi:hypothetical protein